VTASIIAAAASLFSIIYLVLVVAVAWSRGQAVVAGEQQGHQPTKRERNTQ
jgi:hypothetical protein